MNNAKLTLPIQIGHQYARRDGMIVTVLEPHPSRIHGVVYVGGRKVASSSCNEHIYVNNGRVHLDTQQEHPFDLVEDNDD